MTTSVSYWSDWFWECAGGRAGYPADIGYAALCALEVSVESVSGLTVCSAASYLRRRYGMPIPDTRPDRRLRGCIAVSPYGAVIMVDADDGQAERRFTIAHEVSHYILDVHARRERADRMMGGDYIGVLYGSRQPTDEERMEAWLNRVQTKPLAHLMDRVSEGGYGCGQTLSAECAADNLAAQLLAPRSELARVIRASWRLPFDRAVAEAELSASRRFGLPESIAKEYANRLAWEIRGGPSTAERFGFSRRAAL